MVFGIIDDIYVRETGHQDIYGMIKKINLSSQKN